MNLTPARLAALPSLKRVPPDELAAFASAVRGRHLLRGEVLFRAGERGTEACLLLSGRLAVEVGEPPATRNVGDLWPGDLVGEAAWIEPDARRNATVVAVMDSECAVIDREAYVRLADNRAMVALEGVLLGLMARRIRAANLRLSNTWTAPTARPEPARAAEPAPESGIAHAFLRLLGLS